MPSPTQMDGNQPVQYETITMREPLVAEPGRYPRRTQHRGEQMRLRITEPHPLPQHLTRGQGHPRIPNVKRVPDFIPHPLERHPSELDIIRHTPPKIIRQREHPRIIDLNDGVPREIRSRRQRRTENRMATHARQSIPPQTKSASYRLTLVGGGLLCARRDSNP